LLRRGAPDGELRERLKEEGYTPAEIAVIFKPKPYDMRSYYLFFAVAFVLVGLYMLLQYRSKIVLILSGTMFLAYSREVARVKKDNESEEPVQ
jgi:hypothetical protein